ncbi:MULTISPECIES: ParB/RepB/Spo0J family partition protein [Dellaglioa]|uniref:Chromosome partitioning protein, DNA-binding protein n=3 Tax=Dellaglioa TaxID=2767880 RepID=A0A0R1HIH9_9LACO|nr:MULTISPECIES: ParB/RepB/Spo0J family partition protein [Dellaglioa]KRK45896.1 chromosome partitioning protein, DNA-binding protein [Dellaglioa algida DSM 15638]MCZ2491227.1 ParB/RepB/Spo0J family partition protein [Dellaglioa carnosa]MCZ2494305.1 ParB/RepB/Spo0J family partition protein [Dellaglioa carnosa]MDK1717874.1 ParB/RepB/Spo0J family partition protein [Dellaglioa algida]MDK1719467.1 ParB/RepB/Spo0J family partition protein [Dellaglioa algida]
MANNKKGLGKGINALFQDELDQYDDTKESIVRLNLDEIRPNPYQPRKTFNEDALKELAASIKKSGVFQPIIVRESVIKGYEIIAGERRFRASKLAGVADVPAIVRTMTEESMMEVAILENLQREELSPLEEAEAYNTLMEKLNLTQSQVSERLGKSRPYIANYLRLLGLPHAVKELIQADQLSMGQARTLLSLKDKQKIGTLAKRTVKENLTVRELEKVIAQMNGESKKNTKKTNDSEKSIYVQQSENLLKEKFGTQVSIQQSKKNDKGKIEIDYLSTDDLNRILDLLDISLD